MIVPRALAIACLAGLCSCAKPTPRAPRCFDVTTGQNSPPTRAEFDTRQCQGGGVTWGALLRVLVDRRGRVTVPEAPSPGMTGEVLLLDGQRLSIDEEGDAARFCADDPKLVASIRADVDRLNHGRDELRRAMAEADALALECLLEADGGAVPLPVAGPSPALPPDVLSGVEADLARTRSALEKDPWWCFPSDEPHGWTGGLRFAPDGGAAQVAADGGVVAQGSWRWPREGSGDPRIEVLLSCAGARGCAGLLHLDVGPTGRLGYQLGDRRQELIPGRK